MGNSDQDRAEDEIERLRQALDAETRDASRSRGSWTGRTRSLKSLSRWRLTTCASLSGTWPRSVN